MSRRQHLSFLLKNFKINHLDLIIFLFICFYGYHCCCFYYWLTLRKKIIITRSAVKYEAELFAYEKGREKWVEFNVAEDVRSENSIFWKNKNFLGFYNLNDKIEGQQRRHEGFSAINPWLKTVIFSF